MFRKTRLKKLFGPKVARKKVDKIWRNRIKQDKIGQSQPRVVPKVSLGQLSRQIKKEGKRYKKGGKSGSGSNRRQKKFVTKSGY